MWPAFRRCPKGACMNKCAPIAGVSGFDSRSGRCLVAVDPRCLRLTEVGSLFGNPAKAKCQPGWAPKLRSDSCSWARRAFTPSTRRSRCPRTACSLARWSPPTSSTPLPRSPASRCARPRYGFNALSLMPIKSLRPRRQLRPGQCPRPAGADARISRSETQPRPAGEIVWGSGSPPREFLHVDDMADACP